MTYLVPDFPANLVPDFPANLVVETCGFIFHKLIILFFFLFFISIKSVGRKVVDLFSIRFISI
jgi:hypothetical protein